MALQLFLDDQGHHLDFQSEELHNNCQFDPTLRGENILATIPSSSAVEQAAVNRLVIGSNPISGAIQKAFLTYFREERRLFRLFSNCWLI